MVTLARSVQYWVNENFVLRSSFSEEVSTSIPSGNSSIPGPGSSLGGFKSFVALGNGWCKRPRPQGLNSPYGATAAGVAINRTPRVRPVAIEMTTTVLSSSRSGS